MSKTGWIVLIMCLILGRCIYTGLFLARRISSVLLPNRMKNKPESCMMQGYKDFHNPYEESGNYSVRINELEELEIDWINGSVTVELTDEDVIHIQESSDRKIKEKDALLFGINDRKLCIQTCKKNHIGKLLLKDLTVTIPRSLADKIIEFDIDTVSACIIAADLSLEKIEVNTVSGQVELRNITADEADFATASGDLLLRGCSFESLRMDSVSALLSIAGVVNKVKASSISGSVQLYLEDSKDIRITTISGFIALEFNKTTNDLHIDTISALTSFKLQKDASCTVIIKSISSKVLLNMEELQSNQLIMGDGISKFHIDTLNGDVWLFTE